MKFYSLKFYISSHFVVWGLEESWKRVDATVSSGKMNRDSSLALKETIASVRVFVSENKFEKQETQAKFSI